MSEQVANPSDTPIQAKPKRKPGRPRIEVDLKEVEALAATGMPLKYIAEGLGISVRKFQVERNGNGDGFGEYQPAVHAAYKRGIHTCRKDALERIKADKSVASPIYITKQGHVLGFTDQVVNHTGTIKHEHSKALSAWQERLKAEHDAKHVIDITPDQDK